MATRTEGLGSRDLKERADELADEFVEHVKGFKALHPELEPVDDVAMFQAWAIQMLANLQILTENLYREEPLPLVSPLRAL